MKTTVRKAKWMAWLAVLVVAVSASTASAVPGTLKNHQPEKLSGWQNQAWIYAIDVPANQNRLVVTLTGGMGNADLLMKHDSPGKPTLKSNSNPTKENITVWNPLPGRWLIKVTGSTIYKDVLLQASYFPKPSPATSANLGNGHWVNNQNGHGDNRRFRILVPPNAKFVTIVSQGGTGSCSLLVRRGQLPTLAQHDHGSAWNGTNQKVTVNNPPPGFYYIVLHGRLKFQGVSIMARFELKKSPTPPGGPGKPGKPGGPPNPGNPSTVANLGPGHWVHNQNGQANNRHYRIHIPPNVTKLVFRSHGGKGSCALLVRRGGQASMQNHQRAGHTPGTAQVVTWINPPPGVYHALLHGRPAFQGVSLMANFVKGPGGPGGPGGGPPLPPNPGNPPTTANLGPGHWVHNQNGQGNNRHYRIHIPPNVKRLTFRSQGGNGSCALLVRRGGHASPQHHNHASGGPGTFQQVTLHNPPPGVYFALVRGRPQFHGVSVMAEFVMH